MKSYEAVVLCENGHTTTTWAKLVAHDPETDKVTFVMGSSADFCDTCDGAVTEVTEVREVEK